MTLALQESFLWHWHTQITHEFSSHPSRIYGATESDLLGSSLLLPPPKISQYHPDSTCTARWNHHKRHFVQWPDQIHFLFTLEGGWSCLGVDSGLALALKLDRQRPLLAARKVWSPKTSLIFGGQLCRQATFEGRSRWRKTRACCVRSTTVD